MRELKFKWYIRGTDGKVNVTTRSIENLKYGILWRSDFVLMDRVQFTGLLDDNGVEIYEGDILCITDGGLDSYHGIVRWDDSGYRFMVDEGCDRLGLDEYVIMRPTVVGNVYENCDDELSDFIDYLQIPRPWRDDKNG